jgi:hypothetical protein
MRHRRDPDGYYQILKFQRGSALGSQVVDEVKGEANAVYVVDLLSEKMSPEEKAAGWTYIRSTFSSSRRTLAASKENHPVAKRRDNPRR